MVRMKKEDRCPLCKKGKVEWIGVLENGGRKMYCPLCYKITILPKKIRK